MLVDIDAGEAERGHLRDVFVIGREVEHAGSFAVIEIAFAFEAPGIARDGEFNVLAAGP